MTSGLLDHYNKYWSVRLEKSIATPNTLKRMYRYFVNSIKSDGEIRKHMGKKYIVCKNALTAEKEGVHLHFV